MLAITETVDQVFVITIEEGRLDAALAPEFEQQMKHWLADGNRNILIDFKNVDFMDSTGLGALVACLKALGSPRQLILCNVSVKIKSLFKLTRMDRIFVIYRTRSEALKNFSPQ